MTAAGARGGGMSPCTGWLDGIAVPSPRHFPLRGGDESVSVDCVALVVMAAFWGWWVGGGVVGGVQCLPVSV